MEVKVRITIEELLDKLDLDALPEPSEVLVEQDDDQDGVVTITLKDIKP